MNKNAKKMNKIGGLGLLGALTLCSAGAFAAQFSGSVAVKNNIAVENTADLSFGSLSITTAAGSATAADTNIAAFQLSPEGAELLAASASTGAGAEEPVEFVNLGGAEPARARVVTGSNFTLKFPAATWVDELDSITVGSNGISEAQASAVHAAITAGNGIRLQNSLVDPNIADFFLLNLKVGDVLTVGNTFGDPTVDQDTTAQESWDFTAPIGTTEYTFAIGGTLVTDPLTTDPYEELLYEGTFEVTANF